jgi:hypothetical protein
MIVGRMGVRSGRQRRARTSDPCRPISAQNASATAANVPVPISSFLPLRPSIARLEVDVAIIAEKNLIAACYRVDVQPSVFQGRQSVYNVGAKNVGRKP